MNTLQIISQQLKSIVFDLIASTPKIVIAIFVALLFSLAGKRLAILATRRIKNRGGRPATNILILLEKTFHIFFVAVGLFLALSIIVPSLRFSDLFAVLGVSGVAIGFAFRDILQNFFAGIIILVSRTFEVGDRITSGPVEGTVEEISIRSTVVRTDSGDRVIVPNGILMTREITHRYYSEKNKLSVVFYVPIDAHIGAVIRVARDIFREMGSAIDPTQAKVIFESMSERTMTLHASWRTNQVPPGPRASREYFVTRLQEELHRYGAHLGLLEELTVRSHDGAMERSFSLTTPGGKKPEGKAEEKPDTSVAPMRTASPPPGGSGSAPPSESTQKSTH